MILLLLVGLASVTNSLQVLEDVFSNEELLEDDEGSVLDYIEEFLRGAIDANMEKGDEEVGSEEIWESLNELLEEMEDSGEEEKLINKPVKKSFDSLLARNNLLLRNANRKNKNKNQDKSGKIKSSIRKKVKAIKYLLTLCHQAGNGMKKLGGRSKKQSDR